MDADVNRSSMKAVDPGSAAAEREGITISMRVANFKFVAREPLLSIAQLAIERKQKGAKRGIGVRSRTARAARR